MRHATLFFALLTTLAASPEVLDRLSVVVGRQAIKASDIDRDIRITSFLNGQPPDFSDAARKEAASRLIDQALIREQIRTGEFPVAAINEADQLVAATRKERYPKDTEYKDALARCGITETELRDRLLWQLTVLRFIDARFRPEVAADDPVPAGDQITGLLDKWLKQSRKEARIEYLEKSLQ